MQAPNLTLQTLATMGKIGRGFKAVVSLSIAIFTEILPTVFEVHTYVNKFRVLGLRLSFQHITLDIQMQNLAFKVEIGFEYQPQTPSPRKSNA